MQRVCPLLMVLFVTLPLSECLSQGVSPKSPVRGRHFEQRQFKAGGRTLTYWLMSPATIKPGQTYPLVLTLHGRGGNTEAGTVLGRDDMRKKYPCFVLAPATGKQATWARPRNDGRPKREELLPLAIKAVESVAAARPVDRHRIYVTGQSMGGVGTFGAIATSPGTFAAAIPVCGGWRPGDAPKMKAVAVWVFHGDADNTVPVDYSRDMVAALKKAGGTVKFTEYPGVGHNSWSKTYAADETWKWLFAQRRAK